MKGLSTELKVGLFAVAVIVILAWATIRVSDRTVVSSGGYDITVSFENVTGLKPKAPVELAGVQVGVVRKIELSDSRRAKVILTLADEVKLPDDSEAMLRTRGFLGETYVELIPGTIGHPVIVEDGAIQYSARTGDINSLVTQFSSIADDIKKITSSLKGMVGDSPEYPVNRVINNLEEFTQAIRDVTIRNEGNIDRISENLAEMTDQLKELIARGRMDVEESMDRIASITRKIDEGKGTVGRLINDEETVDKLNEAVDNLNDTLGGFKRLETEIGYHAEYLTQSTDFKHYVDLSLRPAPDKALMLSLISDPDPRPTHVQNTTNITAGGNTATVVTDTATINRQKLAFSAQLAKSFYDFTLRGGIIESSGGFGMDYKKGPIAAHFSAFDFSTRFNEKPHLKAAADVNVTRNLFLTGGADDIINNQGTRPEWFVGVGFRFVDDDIKRYLGASSAASIMK